MEKPFYLPDASFGHRIKISDRNSEKQRYYDRMEARGIQVLRDTDESDTNKKKWRGDHAFSPDAATYSLTHFVEPEVAREHPDWNPSQVHAEAMTRFEQRLKQDLAYERLETHHEESVVNWRLIDTKDGKKELATAYGDRMITLSELWEHTKEYAAFVGKPQAYNEAEHKAQLAMQDAFITGGASAFVSILSHPDSVRYVQVWEKNTQGDIVSKQVDLFLSTGKDFSHEEGDALIRNLQDYYRNNTNSTYPDSGYTHLFIETGKVTTKDIRIIARAQTFKRTNAITVPRENFKLQKEKMRSIVEFLREPIHKTVSYFSIDKTKKKRTTTHPEEFEHYSLQKTAASKNKKTGKGEAIQFAMSEWVISQTVVAYALHVPAGSHAALFWFSEIPRIRKDMHAEQKKVQQPQHETTPLNKQPDKQSRRIVASVFQKIKKMILPEKRKKTEKQSFRVLIQEKKKLRDVLLHIHKIDSNKREVMARVTKFIDKISLFLKKKKKILKTSLEKKQETKSEIRYAEKSITVAVHILRIFWPISRAKAPKTLESIKHPLQVLRETPADHEPPVWLLLSIIWFLAMLRESGAVSQPVPQTTPFPLSGVIFVYTS